MKQWLIGKAAQGGKSRSYACFTCFFLLMLIATRTVSYVKFSPVISHLSPSSYARVEMFEVPIAAQQCVVDALKGSHETNQAIVLCHTLNELVAGESFSLGTHDLFDDFLGKDSLSLISVFPNTGTTRQALKSEKEEPFAVDCIVACHHTCDPLDVSIDIVGSLMYNISRKLSLLMKCLLMPLEFGYRTRQILESI